MIIKATQKNTRQAPRKVRLVANAVKNMSLEDALRNLAVIERRSTIVVLKTLRQAIANAVNNYGHAPENLILKNILVTEGPRFRRFRAVSRGRAHTVIKKTSHVTVELEVKDAVMADKNKTATEKTQSAETKKSETTKVAKKPATKTAGKKLTKTPEKKSTTKKVTSKAKK